LTAPQVRLSGERHRAVAINAVARAQTTNRPQLLVQRAEADLTTETLLIEGQKLLWNDDNEIVVMLAGTRPANLSATQFHVLAQLPRGLAPGTYLLKVSRGTGTVQNDVFDLAVGAAGPAGPAPTSSTARGSRPRCLW